MVGLTPRMIAATWLTNKRDRAHNGLIRKTRLDIIFRICIAISLRT